MKARSINNFIFSIVIINIFFTLQGHVFPFANKFFPISKILALSNWGIKHLLIFQPISFTLIHPCSVFDLSYLTSLLFYIYLLKKCADFFILHNKARYFIFLYLIPTALSASIYMYLSNHTITPLFAPYLSLVSIIISSTLLDPNKKILRPVHAKPIHNGIALKWICIAFIAYQCTIGSLSSPPLVYICLINLVITYLFATLTLKANNHIFLLTKLEHFLRRTRLCKNQESRIDRILNKISKNGMQSLSFLDRLYLKIKKSHFS